MVHASFDVKIKRLIKVCKGTDAQTTGWEVYPPYGPFCRRPVQEGGPTTPAMRVGGYIKKSSPLQGQNCDNLPRPPPPAVLSRDLTSHTFRPPRPQTMSFTWLPYDLLHDFT